ncbi:6-phosphogluconolactonase [Patescibacteria group bacterium]
MELKIFTSEEEFITKSTDYITSCCNFEGAKVALSGGSTPGPVYSALGKRELLDFKKAVFFMVDERYVPATDPKSNYKLIIENLPDAHLHSFDTTLPIDECVKDYEDKLHEYLNGPINLSVLGFGTDGHFASIFPNSPALSEKEHLAMHTQTDAHDVKDRLTMTLPLIMQSEKLLVLAKGADKWEVIQKLSDESVDPDSFPARHLMNHHNLLIHYLQS